jgi:hypothetical protein
MAKTLTWFKKDKKTPLNDGWYFWRKQKNTIDPLLFDTFFIERDGDDTIYWNYGTIVNPPKGGEWVGPVPISAVGINA